MKKHISLPFILLLALIPRQMKAIDHPTSIESSIVNHKQEMTQLRIRNLSEGTLAALVLENSLGAKKYDKIMKDLDQGRQGVKDWTNIITSIAEITILTKETIDNEASYTKYMAQNVKHPAVAFRYYDTQKKIARRISRAEKILVSLGLGAVGDMANIYTMTNKQRIKLLTEIKTCLRQVNYYIQNDMAVAKLIAAGWFDPIEVILNSSALEDIATGILDGWTTKVKKL